MSLADRQITNLRLALVSAIGCLLGWYLAHFINAGKPLTIWSLDEYIYLAGFFGSIFGIIIAFSQRAPEVQEPDRPEKTIWDDYEYKPPREETLRTLKAVQIDRSGYVYLLSNNDGLYKIGHTNNPQNRLRTFNVKLPFDVEFVHLIKCHDRFKVERYFHDYYANKRVRGEWFSLDDDDIEYFKVFCCI